MIKKNIKKEKSKPTNLSPFNKVYLKVYLFPFYFTDDFKVMLATAQLSWEFKLSLPVLHHQFIKKSSNLRPQGL